MLRVASFERSACMNCELPEPPRPMWTKMMSGGDCLANASAVVASTTLVMRYPSSSSRRACAAVVSGSSSTRRAVVGLVALDELIVHIPSRRGEAWLLPVPLHLLFEERAWLWGLRMGAAG